MKITKVPAGGKGPALAQVQLDAPKSQISFYGGVKKADTASYVTNGSENQPDDTFAGSYTASGGDGSVTPIEPTFLPLSLKQLVTKNNILSQCVEVMEVNVDGTGHTFEKVEEDTADDDTELEMLRDFFNEPYPGKSMIAIRRALRRDLEDTGCGYLEVARNPAGDIMTINHLDAENMRLIRFDDPVVATKSVKRAGKDVDVQVRVRERRFVQKVNNLMTYFREFGSSRELDRGTGKWAEGGAKLPAKKRASEVLYFTVNREVKTPYGSPRWINQLPSVLGSRKAEEHNLSFFDAGGLPPVLVLVQGGYLGSDVKDQLTAHLSGAGAKHRAAVVEAIAASGSLDSAGTVKVTVERFGAERMQDAMFMEYDARCEMHVRSAFRLPPLFIGKADDYNFATAMTGYMTAEAQVFAPERMEFDERMSYIVRALGAKTYKFKSKPMSLTDIETQMGVIESALTNKMVEPESALTHMNKMSGLKLEYKEPPPDVDPVEQAAAVAQAKAGISPASSSKVKKPQLRAVGGSTVDKTKASTQSPTKEKVRKDDASHLAMLANSWATVLGLRGACVYDDEQIEQVKKQVSELDDSEQKVFTELLSMQSIVQVEGAEGLAQLCGCAAELLAEA